MNNIGSCIMYRLSFFLVLILLVSFGNNAKTELLYIEIPEDISVSELLSGSEPVEARIEARTNMRVAQEGAVDESSNVIIYTKDGTPILPDLENAKAKCHFSGECDFSTMTIEFDEPSFLGNEDLVDIYQELFNDMYPWMVEQIGEPAFTNRVFVQKHSQPRYDASKNRISIGRGISSFFHELTHAFNDDFMPGYFQINEGIAQLMENEAVREINNRICNNPENYPKSKHLVDDPETPECDRLLTATPHNHNHHFLEYFENYNKIPMSNISTGLLRTNVIREFIQFVIGEGGADAYHPQDRILFELYMNNKTILKDVFNNYYKKALKFHIDYPCRPLSQPQSFNLSPLFVESLYETGAGKYVEGMRLEEWLSQRYRINMSGKPGYNFMTAAGFDEGTPRVYFTYFYHDPVQLMRITTEEMFHASHSQVFMSALDWKHDPLCFASETIEFPQRAATDTLVPLKYYSSKACIDPTYDGRVEFIGVVNSPEGLLKDTSFVNSGATGTGLYGVVSNRATGTISAFIAGDSIATDTVNVEKGAFNFTGLNRGTYRLEYEDSLDSNWRACTKTVEEKNQ